VRAGLRCGYLAIQPWRSLETEASIAKLVASETATWIAERALHLQGAQGYMLELQREMIFDAAAAGYRP
jgi:alkylation response protein AidB-like acyl-CoA dehydrogenase